MTTTQPTVDQRTVKAWMSRQLSYDSTFWETEDEVKATELAEAAADEFDSHDWLDDSLHWVWDLPIELETEHRSAQLRAQANP